MSKSMIDGQWQFVSYGTRTGKLATTRADGSPHVVPVWFVLDGDDVLFNTGKTSMKGRNLARDGRAVLCVDDENPPYAFVTLRGRTMASRRGRRQCRALLQRGEGWNPGFARGAGDDGGV
jgi:PPOX class probable F420-dependent enzyme